MAAASAFASSFSSGGGTQSKICNTNQDVVITSSLRLSISSPYSRHARGTFMRSRRTVKSSKPCFRVFCNKAPPQAVNHDNEGLAEKEISPLTLSTSQVQSLLLEVCDTTRIAELTLKVGSFQLHMKRDVGKVKAAPAPLPPASAQPMVASSPASATPVASPVTPPKSNNSATSILPAPVSKTASLFGLLEAAADQGLSFVTSPKVGVFRRGRNVKGRTGKPLVEEGQIIKEGQVVGYLEQLGTQQPVESQVSGEVVQVLWEDGESVGYGDPLISIRPSFPGIVCRAALN